MTEKPTALFPLKVLPKISTLVLAMIAPPVPAGTRATSPLGSPKFGVLLSRNWLL